MVAGDTLPKAFLRTAAANPGVVALRRMVGEGAGGWEETTYGELGDQVADGEVWAREPLTGAYI